MAKYRVKKNSRRSGGIKSVPLAGTVFDWDGSTVDFEGDIMVKTDVGTWWVLPEYVEPVEASREWKVGDHACLLEGARAKGHAESHTLDKFDSRYVTGAEVVVVHLDPYVGDILVKLNGDLRSGWWVDPRFLAPIDPAEPPKKAEVIEETVERTVTETVERTIAETKKTVVLRLTEDEAVFLRTLLGSHVNGSVSSAGRSESRAIHQALVVAGIEDDGDHFHGHGIVSF